MRDICPGVRTVPVLFVAKKLAAPQPISASLAAKWALIIHAGKSQLMVDWVLKIACLVVDVFFSSRKTYLIVSMTIG